MKVQTGIKAGWNNCCGGGGGLDLDVTIVIDLNLFGGKGCR
ncbi:MAG TPA: hypothetical protein VNZ26_16225 [Vicinamibacterales bacterium]|jgi:hypothetical protein|nr:hypothetical protein [Vicinamibacterales bacterium]